MNTRPAATLRRAHASWRPAPTRISPLKHASIFAVPLLLASVLSGTAAEPVSEADRAAVAAVVETAVKAGFPDGTGSTLRGGDVRVAMNVDPEKEPLPLPGEDSLSQETVAGSNRVIYRYRFSGIHLERTDGSWILGLAKRFKPDADDEVNATAAPRIAVDGLTAAAVAAHPFDPATIKEWLEDFDPNHRQAAQATMAVMVPVSKYLALGSDHFAPAVVILHRGGWREAALACVSIADERAGSYWQLRPWMEPDVLFDPTGKYPNIKSTEDAWRKAHPRLVPEPPATALRRALHRWCRNQLMHDERLLNAKVAAAVCQATLDPGDPQHHAPRIAALLASTTLPAAPPAAADLAAKLASWGLPQEPRMIVSGTKKGAGISTALIMPEPAYVPDTKDLDALVALLGDERPSRFIDFSGARSIGDNALRAVAELLEADPRALAKHPTDAPWTATERKKAAAAVQAWWKTHRHEHIKK